MVGILSTAKPRETQKAGNACTKFVVPSIGSTINVGAEVSFVEPGTYVSSPMKEKFG
jgi:hypothetical protein